MVMNGLGSTRKGIAAAAGASEETPEMAGVRSALSELVEAASRRRARLAALRSGLAEHASGPTAWALGSSRAGTRLNNGKEAERLYPVAIDRLAGQTGPDLARGRLLDGRWLWRQGRVWMCASGCERRTMRSPRSAPRVRRACPSQGPSDRRKARSRRDTRDELARRRADRAAGPRPLDEPRDRVPVVLSPRTVTGTAEGVREAQIGSPRGPSVGAARWKTRKAMPV